MRVQDGETAHPEEELEVRRRRARGRVFLRVPDRVAVGDAQPADVVRAPVRHHARVRLLPLRQERREQRGVARDRVERVVWNSHCWQRGRRVFER